MTWLNKLWLIIHILRWRLRWSKYTLDFQNFSPPSTKFITARQAADLIQDQSCVFSNGIAGNARCSIFFYALRDRFRKSGQPRDLTWINSGAQGSRGRVPGTIEEIGLPGLMKRYITGHVETAKAQLDLAKQGKLAIHVLPQGIISKLLVKQGQGMLSLRSEVGLQTFLDPRVGNGSLVFDLDAENLVTMAGDKLEYRLPKIDVALLNAPYADVDGNIYFKHAATITENLQSILAVRKNRGLVFVSVSAIIPKNKEDISISTEQISYIIVDPYSEQTVSVPQRRYWKLFTPDAGTDLRVAVSKLKFINDLLKITPHRTAIGNLMAHLAAALFIKLVPKGGMVNIGVGFPEEVARVLVYREVHKDYIFTTEAGAFGGLPAPGIFFGAAIRPDHLEASSRMFERYDQGLDVAVLGFLEVDRIGNVNVSKRGPDIMDYVGPGGFPDIVCTAQNIIFVGTFMHHAQMIIKESEIKILGPGKEKFVDQVQQITFSAKEALQQRKNVYFITDVGILKLTLDGLLLVATFRGISVEDDILKNSSANIATPMDMEIPRLNPDFIHHWQREGISSQDWIKIQDI